MLAALLVEIWKLVVSFQVVDAFAVIFLKFFQVVHFRCDGFEVFDVRVVVGHLFVLFVDVQLRLVSPFLSLPHGAHHLIFLVLHLFPVLLLSVPHHLLHSFEFFLLLVRSMDRFPSVAQLLEVLKLH